MTGEPVIVDNGDVVPNSGTLILTTTILQDGVAKNLAGKTCRLTIRRESDQHTVIDATLEDHACVITDEVNGIVETTLNDDHMQLLEAPSNVTKAYPYLLAYRIPADPYFPQFLRIYVYGVLN